MLAHLKALRSRNPLNDLYILQWLECWGNLQDETEFANNLQTDINRLRCTTGGHCHMSNLLSRGQSQLFHHPKLHSNPIFPPLKQRKYWMSYIAFCKDTLGTQPWHLSIVKSAKGKRAPCWIQTNDLFITNEVLLPTELKGLFHCWNKIIMQLWLLPALQDNEMKMRKIAQGQGNSEDDAFSNHQHRNKQDPVFFLDEDHAHLLEVNADKSLKASPSPTQTFPQMA